LDGAREIIESTKLPRWGAMQHYFMEYQDKERCKELLQFRQVPFYIVFDSDGALLYAGNQKLDWQTLFQDNSDRNKPIGEVSTFDTKTITVKNGPAASPTSAIPFPIIQQQQQQEEENSTFVIDDMDF
jgi:hypothetical protein